MSESLMVQLKMVIKNDGSHFTWQSVRSLGFQCWLLTSDPVPDTTGCMCVLLISVILHVYMICIYIYAPYRYRYNTLSYVCTLEYLCICTYYYIYICMYTYLQYITKLYRHIVALGTSLQSHCKSALPCGPLRTRVLQLPTSEATMHELDGSTCA